MKMKRIACVLIVVALVVAGVGVESRILIRKDSARRFDAFYGEKANIDVLFLGNSHVMNGITPLEMWNDYGITAYNMGLPGGRVATSYWMLMTALQYTKPRLAVLDCSFMSNTEKINAAYSNTPFDAMPMSRVKLQAAFDLFGDTRKVIEKVIIPFAQYHSRWFELDEKDFRPIFPNLMGYSLKAGATLVERPQSMMAESPEPVEGVNAEYLYRIIEVCKSQDIPLLLTYIPFHVDEQDQNEAGYLGVVAEENGLDYLTPAELADVIDWDTDFTNGNSHNSHMNHRGAKKMTRYFGEYITQRYDLPDHRSEAEYAGWFDYYRDYLDNEDRELREARKWKQALSLLGNERYGLVAAVGAPSLWADDVLAAQMRALGLDAEAVSDAPALYVAGLGATALRFEAAELAGEGALTPLGRLAAEPEQGEGETGYAVTLDGVGLFEALDGGSPLRIAVLNRETGGLVRSFGLEVNNEGKLVVAGN